MRQKLVYIIGSKRAFQPIENRNVMRVNNNSNNDDMNKVI